MQSFYAYHTDIGIKKKTNQDSLLIKEATVEQGNVLLMVICDGMGGLAKGEVASASLISAFEQWFERQLPYTLALPDVKAEIKKQWDTIIQKMNVDITNYGVSQSIQLGTTVTAILFLADGDYIIGHVGDSRAYRITAQSIDILTTDQTFVSREVSEGRMTPEQAAVDPRRNMLLQCVGASPSVKVDFLEGKIQAGDVYMLCCDGFRHVISSEEIQATINPNVCTNAEVACNQLVYLTETNKQRGEVDNITALLAKVW
jgi:serine/threonine protein phosphatase PrpC